MEVWDRLGKIATLLLQMLLDVKGHVCLLGVPVYTAVNFCEW